MIYAIEAPHFCAGLEVTEGRVGPWCAPIIAWARGKEWAEVRAYFLRKGYRIVEGEEEELVGELLPKK